MGKSWPLFMSTTWPKRRHGLTCPCASRRSLRQELWHPRRTAWTGYSAGQRCMLSNSSQKDLCAPVFHGERFHWEKRSNLNIARTWAHDSIRRGRDSLASIFSNCLRIASMPREPMQLPANLAQMRPERMMVKSSSTTGTNGQKHELGHGSKAR